MKTPEQIKEWLQKQEWYPLYKSNAGKEPGGRLGSRTISSAFYWKETPQGYAFWSKINGQFLLWYHKKEEE